MVGLGEEEPVTVWQLGGSSRSTAKLLSEIRQESFFFETALDLDGDLAAIAYCSYPRDGIIIWQLTDNVPLKTITASRVSHLRLNAAKGKLLAAFGCKDQFLKVGCSLYGSAVFGANPLQMIVKYKMWRE